MSVPVINRFTPIIDNMTKAQGVIGGGGLKENQKNLEGTGIPILNRKPELNLNSCLKDRERI